MVLKVGNVDCKNLNYKEVVSLFKSVNTKTSPNNKITILFGRIITEQDEDLLIDEQMSGNKFYSMPQQIKSGNITLNNVYDVLQKMPLSLQMSQQAAEQSGLAYPPPPDVGKYYKNLFIIYIYIYVN